MNKNALRSRRPSLAKTRVKRLSWIALTRQSSALISTLTLAMTLITPQFAMAESVIEKIQRTGTLTAGTSREALPFAFADDQGQLQGYSVDMLKLMQDQLKKTLGRDIQLQLVALNPEDRIPKLMQGEVDIVCDASSYTWERDRKIDFSVSYGLTGTRLLVKQQHAEWDVADLADKKIAAIAATTNEIAIRRAQPQAQVVIVDTHADGYDALQDGTVDAFAADGILLDAWLQSVNNPSEFNIIGYFSKEGIACMVPENNSQFMDQVNYSLVRFMQGYLQGKEPYVGMFDRWFGDQAKVPLTQDLRALVLEAMQLVVDFKEEIPEQDL
nr:amino acid ABC transporter substrate-binding protein [Acaryochloris sp. IP29b_bin.137]